jgi:hypothetical protein
LLDEKKEARSCSGGFADRSSEAPRGCAPQEMRRRKRQPSAPQKAV